MIRIDGSVPPAKRALRVKKFQSNINVRLAILSMTATGVGLTLTAMSIMYLLSFIGHQVYWHSVRIGVMGLDKLFSQVSIVSAKMTRYG